MDEQKPQSIENLEKKTARELIKIRTVFPFTIFPTDVIVDELKVTIITRWLFSKQYFPILLKDIKIVSVSQDIFFASLTFEVSGYESNPSVISFLKIHEAVKAHQVLMGLIAVIKNKAEESLEGLSEKDLVDKLIGIGGTS